MTSPATDAHPTISLSSRARRGLQVTVGGLGVAVIFVAALTWAGPRADVPVPGLQATPEQVVRAYAAAMNERDFATANAIDAREESHLGRFSRPGRMDDLASVLTTVEGEKTHVSFTAEFSGGDVSIADGRQSWGYSLERGDDGRWRIVDAGVA